MISICLLYTSIVHQHQPDQESQEEFCIALMCDKEGEPDLDYYLSLIHI